MCWMVRAYSFLLISPVHTPGHNPICLLKQGRHFFSESTENLPLCFFCSSHGVHVSLNGNILRTIRSASFSEPPCGKGPNTYLGFVNPNLDLRNPNSTL